MATNFVRVDAQQIVRCGRQYASGRHCSLRIGVLPHPDSVLVWREYGLAEQYAERYPAYGSIPEPRIFCLLSGFDRYEDGRYRLTPWAHERFKRAKRAHQLASYWPVARDPRIELDGVISGEHVWFCEVDAQVFEVICPDCGLTQTVDTERLLAEWVGMRRVMA